MESLSLLELNALVRETLETGLPDEYWVRAELSEVRANATGHCYVEFIQKNERGNSLVAKARGIIWANVYPLLKGYFESSTGQAFVAGIKVLVKVSVNFHELYGYSLVVTEIDPTYTLGDLAQRRLKILRQLEEEGVLELNKELEMPVLPQRVAVISSKTAAGFGDFCDQLKNNAYGFYFRVELFPALMQGARLEESVLQALDKINARMDEFDVVVIIRGGGAISELADFDSYMLASACAQFPLPIITGIGHERDDTVLDIVAHTRVKTPTAAAELLIEYMLDAVETLNALKSRLYNGTKQLLKNKKGKLDLLAQTLPAGVSRRLSVEKLKFQETRSRLKFLVHKKLLEQKHQLEMWEQKVLDASPEKQLARGYSITMVDGHAVKNVNALKKGDSLKTILANGVLMSEVEEIINNKEEQ